jgi:hypothetical protein
MSIPIAKPDEHFSANQIEAFTASATIPPSSQSGEVVGGER